MTVLPLTAFIDNYIWLIVDKQAGVFDCVDPGDAQPVLQFASSNQLSLRSILLTHHHHDHIGGVNELMNAYPSCVVYGPIDGRIPQVSKTVKHHDTIKLGVNCYQILAIPGHTATHISYYEQNKKWLFCGDTLFSAGCGRVFDGTIEELHDSLLLLKKLPAATEVFCAHEYTKQNLRFAQTVEPDNQLIQLYLKKLNEQTEQCSLPSNIGLECSINPFLRTDSPAVKNYALQNGASSSDSLEVFSVLRHQKNRFQ
ncbi:MAG: hydroxyacylglutathione hydrolase [Legionellales bacterium]